MRKKANGKLCQIPREFFSHFLSPSSSLFALQPNRFFNIHLDTITIITGDSFSQLGHNISFSLPASLFISSLSLSLPAFLSLSAFVLLSISLCRYSFPLLLFSLSLSLSLSYRPTQTKHTYALSHSHFFRRGKMYVYPLSPFEFSGDDVFYIKLSQNLLSISC